MHLKSHPVIYLIKINEEKPKSQIKHKQNIRKIIIRETNKIEDKKSLQEEAKMMETYVYHAESDELLCPPLAIIINVARMGNCPLGNYNPRLSVGSQHKHI